MSKLLRTVVVFLTLSAAVYSQDAEEETEVETYALTTTDKKTKSVPCEWMDNDFTRSGTVMIGQRFTPPFNGSLDSITIYPQANCTDTAGSDASIQLTMYLFNGSFTDEQNVTEISPTSYSLHPGYIGKSTCKAVDCSEVRLSAPSDPIGFEFKWTHLNDTIANTTNYTWVVYWDYDETVFAQLNSFCVGDYLNDPYPLDGVASFYSSADEVGATIGDWNHSELVMVDNWASDITIGAYITECYDFWDEGVSFSEFGLTMWYLDEPLAIISDWVSVSESSLRKAIINVTEWYLRNHTITDETWQWGLPVSRQELIYFYDTITSDGCSMDIYVWHMFGLCLIPPAKRDSKTYCKGWAKSAEINTLDYDFKNASVYQVETQIRFRTPYPKSNFVHALRFLIEETDSLFLQSMNAAMYNHLDSRSSFLAFGLLVEPIIVRVSKLSLYLSYGLYAFVVLCIIFAIIGYVHGIVYWGADNVRISGIVLFGLYFWDFYSDILFTMNLWQDQYEHIRYLFWASLCFIIIPWVANMYSLTRYQSKWCKDETVRERVYQWFISWQRVLYAAAAFSGSAFGTVELANSYVFGFDFFCMGLNERHLKKFNNNRLWSGILAENAPQLVLQFWFLGATNWDIDESIIAMLAIISSSLSVGAALLDIYSSKRLFSVLKNPESGQYLEKSTLSMLVSSAEIHENKARLQITTYAFRDMLAETLTTHPRSVEMHFPVATASGFKMKFSVFTKKYQANDILKILEASIDPAQGVLQQKIKQCWRLDILPTVEKLQIETDVVIEDKEIGTGPAADDDIEASPNQDTGAISTDQIIIDGGPGEKPKKKMSSAESNMLATIELQDTTDKDRAP